MTKEIKARIQELIEATADVDILQDQIDDRINLTMFCGWMSETVNCCGEEGMNDGWGEYDKENALEYYCQLLKDKDAIEDWDWDYAHQTIFIKKAED